MLIKDYLISKGFKSEWFNHNSTICKIDYLANLNMVKLISLFSKNMAFEFMRKGYAFIPFDPSDEGPDRKIFVHKIFPLRKTKLKFHSKLENDHEFKEQYRSSPFLVRGLPSFESGVPDSFKYGKWYEVSWEAGMCSPSDILLKDPDDIKNSFVFSNVVYTFINELEVEVEA